MSIGKTTPKRLINHGSQQWTYELRKGTCMDHTENISSGQTPNKLESLPEKRTWTTLLDISLRFSAVSPSRPQMEQREQNWNARPRWPSGTLVSIGEHRDPWHFVQRSRFLWRWTRTARTSKSLAHSSNSWGYIGSDHRHLQNNARNLFRSAYARSHSPVGLGRRKGERRKVCTFQQKSTTHRFGALYDGFAR